ncbi:hypothetical protein ACLOJK_026208 [Asimina triloba]
MDGNKEEALRCIEIAKSAIASGFKQRALKFIGIAQRLDSNISVEDLVAACEKLGHAASTPTTKGRPAGSSPHEPAHKKVDNMAANEEQSYTQEQVKLIGEIKKLKDYYAILGVEKCCSREEIRKAYRKLSLKVHPDKNKVPGSEEAFKKVSKAFKCLSDEESRRQYDQTGLVEEFEYNQQHNVSSRRRTGREMFDEDFDPDEIFRSFFYSSQPDVFHSANFVYRPDRGMAGPPRGNADGGGFNIMLLLQIIPVLIILLISFLSYSDPEYTLQKTHAYQIPKVTDEYRVEYFVKSSDFDEKFPQGSPSRKNLEYNVLKDYKGLLGRYCRMEMQKRQWSRNYPTPHCDKLNKLAIA